ncbi:MAG: hypothetical protein O3A29_14575 [Planctomycetota bacterium]|nr:hypothetical protein [Planctomycetota bacterium]
MRYSLLRPAIVLLTAATCWQASATAAEPIDIGSRRELFVDDYLIDQLNNVRLELQKPHDEGIAFNFDQPWEGAFCGYATIIKNGDKYLTYYRGLPLPRADGSERETTCVATSDDGVTWTKPTLGIYGVDDTKENNVILAENAPLSHNFCPMLDDREGVPSEQRFKALGGTGSSGLVAFVSADGFTWHKLREEPVITKGAFDSQNVPLWSEQENCYVCYFRVFVDGIRRISRCTSTDFVHWSDPVLMDYGDKPIEHLYTNQTGTYFRAPHLYVAIAARFFPGKRVLSETQAKAINVDPGYFNDCSDAIFMTSRGGSHYDRTFMEGFLKPGIGLENWVSRTNYPALNVVPINKHEMSFYVNQNYGQPTAHLRRYSLRTDGFVAATAPYTGGELITKPFIFSGNELELNFATSAAGSIRVEIQTVDGQPIEGFSADDAVETIGNEIDRTVHWNSGSDVSSLAAKPVRLRFVMHDAELFSFRFAYN